MIAIALTFALFGAIVGSFVGAAVLRVPAGRGIVTGRSSCDSCGTVLTPIELVPILSFAWQRGRCRHCDAKIAIDQPIAEVGCAIVGMLASVSADSIGGMILFALFGWTLIALALLDARHHWLPNILTLPLIVAGLASVVLVPNPALIDRLCGAAVGYCLLEALRIVYRRLRKREGLGGGDSKLFAAIGAWLGVEALPWVMLAAGLFGLLVVAIRAARGHHVSRFDRLPLGTLLAVAAIAIMPLGAAFS
jgi:leader peptidase (prepilin peptidase)/N-methyltransferase